jgi:hypothetical protein
MYFGPEVVMPLASLLAAAVGVFLLAGRRTVRFTRTTVQKIRHRFKRPPPAPTSHTPSSDQAGGEPSPFEDNRQP